MERGNEQWLYEKLKQYSKEDFYPFHMPGHKRQILFDQSYSIDITEIDGFDDLHHPDGILKDKMEKAAQFYGADQSFYLVNGSTGGILSAISTVTEIGDEILIARNCHKSVFHAVFLRKLKPHYVYPQLLKEKWINGGISVNDVEKQLQAHPNIKAVVVVSPTYEGIVSDIKKISEISHRYNIPLIVDEAHGAHFPYGKGFPKSALESGADLVIQSLHKTLPAMTQTGILHKKSSIVSEEKLKFYLQVYQTSSPSYVLMASIDACLNWMITNQKEYMERYRERLRQVYKELTKLRYIWHLSEDIVGKNCIEDFDCGKLVFGSQLEIWSGERITDILRKNYHLEMEMCTPNYVIAMTSVMDSEQGLKRLTNALKEIDQVIEKEAKIQLGGRMWEQEKWNEWEHQTVLSPYEASLEENELVAIEASEGRICAEASYIYPPGIPFIVPGELLEKKDIEQMLYYRRHGFRIQGGFHKEKNGIAVIKKKC